MLHKLIVGLGIFLLATLFLFALTYCNTDKLDEVRSYTDPQPASLNPEVTEASESIEDSSIESDAINRYIVDQHKIRYGESFSFITGLYWDDIFLWPDLYVLNDLSSEDPDIIYPDEIVEIYNRLGRDDEYNENETELILNAYIEVYKQFKALGPHKNNSAWTLLWCGMKYNDKFLSMYAEQIDSGDREMAEKYVSEEGMLD